MKKIASNISKMNRERKYMYFLSEIRDQRSEIRDQILDVGFANIEYSPVDNYLEKNYPFTADITALGLQTEGNELFSKRYPEVNTVLYDGGIFPFDDKKFDIGWSNAVLEHVGGEDRQILFVKELCRTCKKVFFTTPNRFFPVELHTRLPLVHWLPKSLCDRIYNALGFKWATGDAINLLSKRNLKKILKLAGVKSYTIKHNRLLGFTMDFCVVIKD